MPLFAATHKLHLVVLLAGIYLTASARDSTITTYWRNGYIQSVKVYKLKLAKNAASKPVPVLGRLKSEKYFTPFDNEEDVSKEAFDFFYRHYTYIDSLHARVRQNQYIPAGGKWVYLKFSPQFSVPVNAFFRALVLKQCDTLIQGKAYSIVTYPDSAQLSTSHPQQKAGLPLGALRAEDFCVYYFDTAENSEKLLVNLKALFPPNTDLSKQPATAPASTDNGIGAAVIEGLAKVLGVILIELLSK